MLKLADRDRSALDDLLDIAQYDLSARSSSAEKSLRKSLRRIADKVEIKPDRLKRITSSTGLRGF